RPSAGARTRVAVLPLRNDSPRRGAGELVALEIVRHLASRGELETIEPGVVREALLQSRMIGSEGVSTPQLELLGVMLHPDLVVSGTVFEYADGIALDQPPAVDFITQVFDVRQGRIVWSSLSHNSGADGVRLFDWGRVRTAQGLSSRMVAQVVERARRALLVEREGR
ncbi:MAG TPA: hypothetical protein VJS92_17990, partial [Candidatus Polarisedimenticolaceae bacterium]|nr:hypothetical protein [Candidatus Polarisedimenticolaceae bacterium]